MLSFKAVNLIGAQIPGQPTALAAAVAATTSASPIVEVVAQNVDFGLMRLFTKTLETLESVKDVKTS